MVCAIQAFLYELRQKTDLNKGIHLSEWVAKQTNTGHALHIWNAQLLMWYDDSTNISSRDGTMLQYKFNQRCARMISKE